MENVTKTILEKYRSLFNKPIFWLIMVIYVIVITIYTYKGFFEKNQKEELEKINLRLTQTQAELEKNKNLLQKVNSVDRQFGFLKKLEFREDSINKDDKDNLLRALDYADFAITKHDYKYAEQFYLDANQKVNSSVGHYYLGRLYYIQGLLEKAEAEWRKAISIDQNNRYPEIRFYLGILLHELNKDNESKQLLNKFLGH